MTIQVYELTTVKVHLGHSENESGVVRTCLCVVLLLKDDCYRERRPPVSPDQMCQLTSWDAHARRCVREHAATHKLLLFLRANR